MEYLKRFAIWFITGFAATLGVFVALLLATFVQDHWRHFSTEVTVPVEGIALSNTEISKVTKMLTIDGTVSNKTGKRLSRIDVKIELHQDGKTIFECTDEVRKLPGPGESGRFSADCYGVETRDVPAGTVYKLTVLSASAGE